MRCAVCPWRRIVPDTITCMLGSKMICTPGSTMTVEVAGILMFWQIS
jgi:hypothetical protein